MATFFFYSYLTTALSYSLLLYNACRPKNRDPVLIVAVICSLTWALSILATSQFDSFSIADTFIFESIRNVTWFLYLASLLSQQTWGNRYTFLKKPTFAYCMVFFTALIGGLEANDILRPWLQLFFSNEPRFTLHIVSAILGLILVEQLYRNAPLDTRWNLKFLCFGLGTMFVVDLVTYSKSMLFVQLDFMLWQSRSIINMLMVPLLNIALYRITQKSVSLSSPRKTFFYTSVLVSCGLYLILMATVGTYIRQSNAIWGETVQILFIFLTLLLLVILFSSGKIKALAKYYFNKHFFHYSYDYREEWLKLSKSLANLTSFNELKSFSITSLAGLVESCGGGLWLKNDSGGYCLVEQQNLGFTANESLKSNEPLLTYLANKQWVIDFIELAYEPKMYADIDLSAWRTQNTPVWLIIPLLRVNNLEGLVVLTQARVPRRLSREDRDLLKTVAMQLANALALIKANEELALTRQFEAYNRVSAYLVHDLKNLVAQVSLIVKNADKHKHNPEFIDDSIDTLQNVASKMLHIIGQLKQGKTAANQIDQLNLKKVIQDVIKQQTGLPNPQLILSDDDCFIYGNNMKLTAVLGHLVQNAQDATNDLGWIKITLRKTPVYAEINIMDNGFGMDQQFIAERLFKPFDTTKGNAGMGIGAYEARDYILANGGHLQVESQLGQGTQFIIQFPLA